MRQTFRVLRKCHNNRKHCQVWIRLDLVCLCSTGYALRVLIVNLNEALLTQSINEAYHICHNQMEPCRQFLSFVCQCCPQSIFCSCFWTPELDWFDWSLNSNSYRKRWIKLNNLPGVVMREVGSQGVDRPCKFWAITLYWYLLDGVTKSSMKYVSLVMAHRFHVASTCTSALNSSLSTM